MTITLHSTDRYSRLELQHIQPAGDDFGCTMCVESRGFAGQQRFYFNVAMLRQFCDDLGGLNGTTFHSLPDQRTAAARPDAARVVLKEGYEPDQLAVCENERLGICVSGRLMQHGPPRQELRFSFVVSEPAIVAFQQALRGCLDSSSQ